MITTSCPSVFGNLSPVWKFDNNALQVGPKKTEFFAGTPPSQIFIFHRNRLVCVSDRKIRGRKTESYLHRSRRRRWRHQRTATIAHLTPTERSTSARCDVAKRLALARDVARTSGFSLSFSLSRSLSPTCSLTHTLAHTHTHTQTHTQRFLSLRVATRVSHSRTHAHLGSCENPGHFICGKFFVSTAGSF